MKKSYSPVAIPGRGARPAAQLIQLATVTLGGTAHPRITLEDGGFVFGGRRAVIHVALNGNLGSDPFRDEVHHLDDAQSLPECGFNSVADSHDRGRFGCGPIDSDVAPSTGKSSC
jgi:hypothetical protein